MSDVTYAGEAYLITTTAEDFDALEAITPDDVQDVTCEVFDRNGASVLASASMTWDAEKERWYRIWMSTENQAVDGTPVAAGSYKIKVIVLDLSGRPTWEILRVRLKASPV